MTPATFADAVSIAYRYVPAGPGAALGPRASGGPVAIPDGLNDLAVEQAYRLQYEVVDTLVRQWGVARAGFKISCTGAADRALIGALEPTYGTLTNAHLLDSGASIDLAGTNQPLVEPELVFRLIREPAPDATFEELADSVEVAAGLEVPICRFRNWWPEGAMPNLTLGGLIADNAVAGFVVVGPRWVRLTAAEIDAMAVELCAPDGRVSRGHATNVLGSPLAALSWLMGATRRLGVGIPAGSMVSSGTLTNPIRAVQGTFTATYPLVGDVTVTFADPKLSEERNNNNGA